jgi:hypothetical protein
MVAPVDFRFSFRDVHILSPEKVYFVAGDDDAEKKNQHVAWILRWQGRWDSQAVPLRATGVVAVQEPKLTALIMGIDGEIGRWDSPQIAYEMVDASDDGPQNSGDLREIRRIAGKAYVVGMERTVYRFESAGRWTRMDAGVRVGEDDESDAGFNSIDGFSEKDLYAVGWDGEIWRSNGRKWSQVDSPTNLALFRVVCAPDGNVYACGQRGTLLKGQGTQWQPIEHSLTDEDFYGATHFKGELYFSTLNGLFRIREGQLEKVDIKSAEPKRKIATSPNVSFFRLDAHADVIWSIGRKMAIYSTDGERWYETPYA